MLERVEGAPNIRLPNRKNLERKSYRADPISIVD